MVNRALTRLFCGGLPRVAEACDMASRMTLAPTLSLAAVALLIALAAGWAGARPPNPARGPRMVPYRPIMMAAAVTMIMLLVHAANLLGMKTGR